MFRTLLKRSFSTKPISSEFVTKELHPSVLRLDYLSNNNNLYGNRKLFRGPLKAAILDWSGTTLDAHVIAPAVVFHNVFAKHGVPISMKEARKPMGLRKDLHIQKILDIPEVKQRWIDTKNEIPNQETVDMLFKDFVPMQLECLEQYSTLIPGCAETVNRLKDKYGFKIGVSTGFTECMVEILLNKSREQGFIPDSSVCGDTVINNLGFRPAPFMIYTNLLNLGIYPIESVIKVDDTISGIGEGLNAGCWTVACYGYSNYTNIDSMEQWTNMSDTEKNKRQEMSKEILLKQSGAHYVIKDISLLEIVVKDINQRLENGEHPMSNNYNAKLYKDH